MKAKFKNWTCLLFHFKCKVYEQERIPEPQAVYMFLKKNNLNLTKNLCIFVDLQKKDCSLFQRIH